MSVDDRAIELRQILGRYGEIRVEDHQELVAGVSESEPNRIALALAGLRMENDLPFGMRGDLAFDLCGRVVGRSSLDEDQLGLGAEHGGPFDDLRDHPGLVATRDDDRDAQVSGRRYVRGLGDDPPRQAELTNTPDARYEPVQERRQQRDLLRPQDLPRNRDGLQVRKRKQVANVSRCHPVLDRFARLEPKQLGQVDQRPPKLVVRMDHDPGAIVSHRVDVAEEELEVEGERNEIGQDHVVELLVADELLACSGDELELGMPCASQLRHLLADVYSDAPRGPQGSQQVATTGPDLENPHALRDEEAMDRLDQSVVGAIPSSPATLDRRELVEESCDRAKVLLFGRISRACDRCVSGHSGIADRLCRLLVDTAPL